MQLGSESLARECVYFSKPLRVEGKDHTCYGASRGIGFSAASALAEAGADGIVCSRNKTALDNVVRYIESLGRKGKIPNQR